MNENTLNGKKIQISYYDTLPSTNALLKEECKKGAPNYYTVIADRQTSGRGRLGRSFFSDVGGLYMSFLLRSINNVDVISVTATAGVSTAEAIEEIYGVKCGIKWVNDLIYNGRKVCGILAEGVISESGELEGIVIGIGVNISPPQNGFRDEIKDIAGAISDRYVKAERDALARAIIKRFDSNISSDSLIDKYRSMSNVIGREIKVISPNEVFNAKAIGIDEKFGLVVITEDNEEITLRSGEISIRTK